MNKLFLYFLIVAAASFTGSISPVPAGQTAVLTIEPDVTFQTIEGFGAFNTISFWKDDDYEKKIDFLAGDMGLSILRLEFPPTFQPDKKGDYDLNGKVFGGPDLQHNFRDVRELHKKGINKFIASIWSPPAWMKTLNSDGKGPSVNKGGSLKSDAYGDFADYCAAYYKTFEKETGVELYALGLQNEPEFSEPYNSCVYSPEQMHEALQAVGRVFKRKGIHTKIYLPEALPQQKHIGDFFEAVNDDPETRKYYDIFAIHNYDADAVSLPVTANSPVTVKPPVRAVDGMNVGGATAMQWEKYYNLTSTVDPPKELWMTETSGHPNTWKGAMLLAANIYNALYYGNINAWLWWAIADKKSSEVYALIIDGQPTARYYTSKHYYKYIRPGAVRIKSESGNPDLLSLSFKNSGEYKYVSVLINKGDNSVEVDLSKTDIHSVPEIYLSTENNFWSRPAPGNGKNLSLPPMSIATLTWK